MYITPSVSFYENLGRGYLHTCEGEGKLLFDVQCVKEQKVTRNITYKIPFEKRMEVYECYKMGYGYKKTVKATGLKRDTVRYYIRRFRAGKTDWFDKPPADLELDLGLEEAVEE